MKLNSLCGNAIMNWMRHYGNLKYTPSHMNYVLVATWEAFKLLSAKIPRTLSRIHPPLPLQTLAPKTKLVPLVLNRKTERNRMILERKIRPILNV